MVLAGSVKDSSGHVTIHFAEDRRFATISRSVRAIQIGLAHTR